MQAEQLTLSALNKKIKEVLLEGFPSSVWVVAEIMEMNVNRSGHCYLELIEKAETGEQIVARVRATIWAFQYRMLRPYFETTTGISLTPGLRILSKCTVEFHEQYGLSLNITDIDPSYTMGELARKKQEVIKRLRQDGVFDMNRETELIAVPQRIAIISSETAAGYGDFMNSLRNNPYQYQFYTRLFPAVMQGLAAEASVIAALEQIYEWAEHFDCVVLIRGGGSQADLECFNSYEIAAHIAQFPIPVLTGIGHERDETVADLVAYMHLKTPTAVAEFLIDQLNEFAAYLQQLEDHFAMLVKQFVLDKQVYIRELSNNFQHLVKRIVQGEEQKLEHTGQLLRRAVAGAIRSASGFLDSIPDHIQLHTRNILSTEKRNLKQFNDRLRSSGNHALSASGRLLEMYEKQCSLVDPVNTLKRGFTITSSGGKIITSLEKLEAGDEISTRFRDGEASSKIERIKKNK